MGSASTDNVVAVAHISPEPTTAGIGLFINAIAVDLDVRHTGGGVADQTMEQIKAYACSLGDENLPSAAILRCNIHTRNVPSQLMAERAGFEPMGLPTGNYQTWTASLS